MKQAKVLVCPLDWGLGHATRCIPVIRYLMAKGAHVVVAADGPQLALLRSEFQDAEFITFPGYGIKYSKTIPAALKLIADIPGILFRIRQENRLLSEIISRHSINMVISDNRYGLYNPGVFSVIITHQVNIIPPCFFSAFSGLLHKITGKMISRFDECWIPDFEGEHNLSGKLSHGHLLPVNIKYAGILSRFESPYTVVTPRKYEMIAIVSGPEPQRSIFEERLLAQLPVNEKHVLLIRGIPGNTDIKPLRKYVDVADHLPSGVLENILRSSPLVISRAGYSTLMDLSRTGNKALLVPTPGQTEQEYLAGYMAEKGIFYAVQQKKLNLKEDIPRALEMSGIVFNNLPDQFTTLIDNALNNLK